MVHLNANMEEGLIILLVGMGIVFLSLILLHMVFSYVVPWTISMGNAKRHGPEKVAVAVKQQSTGEEMAAIAATVHAFLEEAHDEENAILTINKSSKNYSPWSSKIYATHHLAGTQPR